MKKSSLGPSCQQVDAPITQPFDKLIANGFDDAVKRTQAGQRKYRTEAICFNRFRDYNLALLMEEFQNGTYKPLGYKRFVVYEPKERLVHAPYTRDKVAQLSIQAILEEIYKPIFIRDSYACQKDKGQHKAINKLQHFMRLCYRQYGDGWISRVDVKKFFYSVDRTVLKELYRKHITDERFLYLLDAIVDSSPTGETGIPLGNATSQTFANILGNELDQRCKRWLCYKWYVRFNDDAFVVAPTREEAKERITNIVDFLKNRLHLTASPTKTKIFPIAQGVTALGFRILTTHKMIKPESIARAKRKKKAMMRTMAALPQNKRAAYRDEKVIPCVNSIKGHIRHGCGFTLMKKIFGDLKYIQIDDPRYFYGKRLKPKGWKPNHNKSGSKTAERE